MGKMSKEKGARGEREWAAVCVEHGYKATRTAQHMGKNGGEADVVGVPGIHFEVKRTESLRIYDAIDQAKRDAKEGLIRAVAHRKNNREWIVIMPACDWFELYKTYEKDRYLQKKQED